MTATHLFFESDSVAVYKGIKIRFCMCDCHRVDGECVRHCVSCCDLTYSEYIVGDEADFDLFIRACESLARRLIERGKIKESDLILNQFS